MNEKNVKTWVDKFQQFIQTTFEAAKKSSSNYDKDLFYAGKFANMKELHGWIERHPVGDLSTFVEAPAIEDDDICLNTPVQAEIDYA